LSAHFQKWHAYSTFLVSSILITLFAFNSCDRNGTFWCPSKLVKQSSSFTRKHRISLQMCVRQTVRLTRKPGWLQNLATDAGMCIQCTRHMSVTPATWCGASLTHGQAYHKTSKQLAMEKAIVRMHEGKKASLWTSAKLKPASFKANTLHNWLFSQPPTVYPGNTLFRVLYMQLFKRANKILQ